MTVLDRPIWGTTCQNLKSIASFFNSQFWISSILIALKFANTHWEISLHLAPAEHLAELSVLFALLLALFAIVNHSQVYQTQHLAGVIDIECCCHWIVPVTANSACKFHSFPNSIVGWLLTLLELPFLRDLWSDPFGVSLSTAGGPLSLFLEFLWKCRTFFLFQFGGLCWSFPDP